MKKWVKESFFQTDPGKEKELLDYKRRINELEKTLGDHLLENYFSKKNIPSTKNDITNVAKTSIAKVAKTPI